MKQNKTVKSAGPFHVDSHSQGEGLVYFKVFPAFPKYNDDDFVWAKSRYNKEGGGPGIFTAITTAKELASFLNSIYTQDAIDKWDNTIVPLIDDISNSLIFAQCENCGTVSKIPPEWIYCPLCGKKYKKDENCNNT